MWNFLDGDKQLYTWDKGLKFGNKLNRPIDDFNHLYGCNAIMHLKNISRKAAGWLYK